MRRSHTLGVWFGSLAIGLVVADPILQMQGQDFADPSFINVDGTYYAYATGSGGKKVSIASATNFDGPWTFLSDDDGLPNNPPAPWVIPDGTGSGALVYAPDVVQRSDGTFVLYFSATVSNPIGGVEGKTYHCVGAATSSSPTGPFNPEDSPFACPIAGGGAIDPSGFQDVDGANYVVYKVDGNNIGDGSGSCGNSSNNPVSTPIMLQKMMSDLITPDGDAVQILDRGEADGPLIEAPSLNVLDGTYYLFFSSNCYSSGEYDTSYATATTVNQSPYVKQSAPAAPLMQRGTFGLTDPGGATVDSAGDLIMFHADADQPGGARYMYTGHISETGTTVQFS